MSKTINYKEKYEKALKAITKLLNKGDRENLTITVYCKEFEEIFSELDESADKRISNTIIKCLKGNIPDNNYREECLAWLEKVRKDNKFLKSIKVGDIITKSPDGILINLGQSDRALEHHNRVEQLTDFEKAFQGMCCDKNKSYTKECCKTLLELARKQLYSEWSEYDERLRKTSVGFLAYCSAKGCENAVECIDWINSIKQRIAG